MILQFLKKIVWFSIPLIILYILSVVYFSFISKKNFPYEILYNHQIDKIHKTKKYSTIFIGDSSLGNAIDSDYFSEKTSEKSINLALTGVYGYAGSYNILKQAFLKNPNLKNVIIMQTLGMSGRKTSYQGYWYSINELSDLYELNLYEIIQVLLASDPKSQIRKLFESKAKTKTQNYLKNDYIKQNPEKRPLVPDRGFSANNINRDKYRFLKKILSFTQKNGINLYYVHGPNSEERVNLSSQYIEDVNTSLKAIGINLIEDVIKVPIEDIGDEHDHVSPNTKRKYTEVYLDLLMRNGVITKKSRFNIKN
jgi:hypothetical protein